MPNFSHRRPVHKKTAAVVITGGSSGIGKCFIGRICKLKREILVCNISRTKPEINDAGVRLFHFPVDLSKSEDIGLALEAVRNKIESEAGEGEILLINNSGFGAYGDFQSIGRAVHRDMIAVNVAAAVEVTELLLPLLLERGGAIVNIASTAAFQPTPQLATYGATKAFLRNWSLALNEDLRGTRVRSLCVCPGPTATNFFKAAGFSESPLPGGVGQTADDVVDATFAALAKGKTLVVSGWSNKITSSVSGLLPLTWVTPLAARILRSIRKK